MIWGVCTAHKSVRRWVMEQDTKTQEQTYMHASKKIRSLKETKEKVTQNWTQGFLLVNENLHRCISGPLDFIWSGYAALGPEKWALGYVISRFPSRSTLLQSHNTTCAGLISHSASKVQMFTVPGLPVLSVGNRPGWDSQPCSGSWGWK